MGFSLSTTSEFDDFGNLLTSQIVTSGRTLDHDHLKTITNEYEGGMLSLSHSEDEQYSYAELGRLSRSTTEVTLNPEESATRVAVFTYYTSGAHAGMMETETVETDPSLEDARSQSLTKRYIYDRFGNPERVETTGWDGNSVVTRYSESRFGWLDDAGRDSANGRYLTATVNSFGQIVETILPENRNALGLPLRATDINGVASEVGYGVFGRAVQTYSDNGAWTHTLMRQCDFSCPPSAIYISDTTQAGGGQSRQFIDVLGRVVRTATISFDGRWVLVDVAYDKLGRVIRQSEPYFESDGASHWTHMTYDILGRVVRTDLPGRVQDVRVQYDGLSKTTINPLDQTKTETENALGQLIQVIDDIGGEIVYTYTADGNLNTSTVSDPTQEKADVQVKLCYDTLGRKTAMRDPDKGGRYAISNECPVSQAEPVEGWWLYQYNGFGELIRQFDAKGQSVENHYDLLGRVVRRTDHRNDSEGSIEGDARWTYVNAPSGPNLGLLERVEDTVSGYRQSYIYDSLSRISETQTDLPGSGLHFESATYDQFGRPYQVFDAAGDGNFQFSGIENEYNTQGFLARVLNANDVNDEQNAYYTILNTDARGQVSLEQTGNNVTVEKAYDAATGWLTDIRSSSIFGSNDIQDHHYERNDIGNLLSRSDESGGKSLLETFTYDGLNRLRTTTLNSGEVQETQYDSFGNIIFKTGVGNYRYGDECAESFQGPHAVCYTDGDGASYQYDANGNMVSDGTGRSLTYTTFDKVAEVSKGAHTTTFAYGPSRSRYLRTDENASGIQQTFYLNNVEKIVLPNGRERIKRYLPGGALITIERNALGHSEEFRTQYMHNDHLGSLDVITDEIGLIATDDLGRQQLFSFDSWGQRRNAQTWEALAQQLLSNFRLDVIGVPTTRGFTMHEHMEEVGIIHMNGRIYDPRLGRFLQADPFIQAASNTQSYNRYSYVMNNPLNATDPSGYFGVSNIVAAVGIVFTALSYFACGGCSAAVAGFFAGVSAAYAGGDLSDVAIAAVTAAVTTYVTVELGGASDFWSKKTLQIGALGGITSVLNGGKFGHGFVSAGVGSAVGGKLGYVKGDAIGQNIGRGITSAVIGGTVSRVTGGKFANGAAFAAFSWAVSAGVQASDGYTNEEGNPLLASNLSDEELSAMGIGSDAQKERRSLYDEVGDYADYEGLNKSNPVEMAAWEKYAKDVYLSDELSIDKAFNGFKPFARDFAKDRFQFLNGELNKSILAGIAYEAGAKTMIDAGARMASRYGGGALIGAGGALEFYNQHGTADISARLIFETKELTRLMYRGPQVFQ